MFLQKGGDLSVKKSLLTSTVAQRGCLGQSLSVARTHSRQHLLGVRWELMACSFSGAVPIGSPALRLGCKGTWFLEVKASMNVLTAIPGASVGRDPSQVKGSPGEPCSVEGRERSMRWKLMSAQLGASDQRQPWGAREGSNQFVLGGGLRKSVSCSRLNLRDLSKWEGGGQEDGELDPERGQDLGTSY